MPIDEQIERVRDWVLRPDAGLLGPDATQESEALWRTVRSVDPRTAPKFLARQLDEANTLLGWFHQLRHQLTGDPVDLAKAVVCLEVVADDHRTVPLELEAIVGRFTDPREQALIGTELLAASMSNPAQALLDAGIQLVTPTAAGQPARLSSLCLAHRRRYERSGSVTDLERAIETGEQAVAVAAKARPADGCLPLPARAQRRPRRPASSCGSARTGRAARRGGAREAGRRLPARLRPDR